MPYIYHKYNIFEKYNDSNSILSFNQIGMSNPFPLEKSNLCVRLPKSINDMVYNRSVIIMN